MNLLLSILQFLLSFHTIVGAIWKFSNSEQMVPSLQAIPHSLWISLAVIEIILSVFLDYPLFKKKHGFLAPIAAIAIGAEMLFFCVMHLMSSDAANKGPMIYWLVVAAICAFIAYGRLFLKPIK